MENLLAFHPAAALAHTMKRIVNSLLTVLRIQQLSATFSFSEKNPLFQKKKKIHTLFSTFFLKLIGEEEIVRYLDLI